MENTQNAPVEEKSGRGLSTIQFPYSDIEDAIFVAIALMKGGGMPLSRDQLAAAMGASPVSGSFNTKIGTARAFQVIETKDNKYQLTEVGFEIIDPTRQKDALVKAFLSVELYKKTYEEFKGKLLPPRPHGLENAFVNFGVTPKQKERARTAFDKSARIAGFFPNGNEDRLVLPFGGASLAVVDSAPAEGFETPALTRLPERDRQAVTTLIQTSPDNLHPSILNWLEELPAPKTEWSKEQQADWLQALATMFRTIYKSDTKESISISVSSPA